MLEVQLLIQAVLVHCLMEKNPKLCHLGCLKICILKYAVFCVCYLSYSMMNNNS